MMPRKNETHSSFLARKRAYDRHYRKEHPQQYKEKLARSRHTWRKYREQQRFSRTGFTAKLFKRLLAEQKNRCAICNKEFGQRKGLSLACADHAEGQIIKFPRAILCGSCNRGIGFLGDNPETCLQAAKYLAFHEGRELMQMPKDERIALCEQLDAIWEAKSPST